MGSVGKGVPKPLVPTSRKATVKKAVAKANRAAKANDAAKANNTAKANHAAQTTGGRVINSADTTAGKTPKEQNTLRQRRFRDKNKRR